MLLDVPSTRGIRGEALMAVDEVERLLTARVRPRSRAAVAVAEAAERIRALDGAVAIDLCLEELISDAYTSRHGAPATA